MVQIKGGKPVVPADNNAANQDIKCKYPSFNGKTPKPSVDTIRMPIKIEEGFGNQYRTDRNAVSEGDKDCYDEIAKNGK